MYTVYILYSDKTGQYYIGYTNDIERRLGEHNRKKGKFTDRGIPWVLKYTENYTTKDEAQKREAYIKSRKSKQYIRQLISGGD